MTTLIDTLNTLKFPGGKTVELMDALWLLDAQFLAGTAGSSAAVLNRGNEVELSYGSGASVTYSGVVFANPNATSGTATATKVIDRDGNFEFTRQGHLNYHYNLVNGVLLLVSDGGTVDSVSFRWGQTTIRYDGAISQDAAGNFSGTLTSIIQNPGYVETYAATGTLYITGSAAAIAQGSAHTSISGVMTSLTGGALSVTNAAIQVSANMVFDNKLFSDAANWKGSETFTFNLAANLDGIARLSAGDGNDTIKLSGNRDLTLVDGGNGNDVFAPTGFGYRLEGGAGKDTLVLGGKRADYVIGHNGDMSTVATKWDSSVVDTLSGIERVQFNDTMVALDINGVGGQAYRLYQAAFNRAPDLDGLGFWIYHMDKGMSLNDAAQQFMASPEFKTLYGNAPTNADFVDRLYHNVLHRSGEAEGVNFWMDYLTNGGGTQAKVLAFFGESPENQAALIGTIGSGFSYTLSFG